MTIKQRAAIPGGTCEFDLPSFHHYCIAKATRRADLDEWLALSASRGVGFCIGAARFARKRKIGPADCVWGLFQQMPMERSAHMLRLTLRAILPCVPEISANKYALNIRFILPGSVQRTKLHEADIEFGPRTATL